MVSFAAHARRRRRGKNILGGRVPLSSLRAIRLGHITGFPLTRGSDLTRTQQETKNHLVFCAHAASNDASGALGASQNTQSLGCAAMLAALKEAFVDRRATAKEISQEVLAACL